jgi:hypothetical protein
MGIRSTDAIVVKGFVAIHLLRIGAGVTRQNLEIDLLHESKRAGFAGFSGISGIGPNREQRL